MFKKIKIKSSVLYAVIAAVCLIVVGIVDNKQSNRRVKSLNIIIDRTGNNYFVEENDVIDLITMGGTDPIVDKKYQYLDLKEVEKRIKFFKFVADAQVSKDHKGNINVLVKQKRPIARIIYPNGSHAYIGSDGTTLSTSEKFTSRVIVIDGAYAPKLQSENFLQSEEGRSYFDVLMKIDNDKFWKTQLAQMTIDRDGEIVFSPQVGRQSILMGKPKDMEDKFRNLELFYKNIIPTKGWNAYNMVNLKFKNQIICE